MMTENQLIKNLQALKQIKPRETWVSSVKYNLFGEQKRASILDILPGLLPKGLAYAAITVFGVLVVILGLSTTAMPGDPLFQIRKITEQSRASLLSVDSKPGYNLEVASKRLGELAFAIEENKTANIAPAIQEVKDNINQAIKNLSNDSGDFNSVALQVKEFQNAKTEVETLGVVMLQENDDLNNALAPLVENEIKILDSLSKAESLTLAQEIRLVEIKSHYKKGEFTASLEKILLITSK